MRVETDEPEILERIAALDVGKAEVVCCARVPDPRGQRMQEVRTVSTMTAALLGLGDWLAEVGVSRVVMEATRDYSDYYANRTNPERRARHHIRELQALGYTVTLNPAA
jgi:hypothetical protein